jgi:glycerol-3-phosphate acyltransferase PlsY
MSPSLGFSLVAAAAYLVGSLPFGYLIGRWRGVDVRTAGSGNIGATNVGRLLGKKWGGLVLLLDGLKGLLPTLLLPHLVADDRTHAAVLAGVAAILGHMFPCWLRFRGGKGVATALGVALVLSWQATLIAAAVFLMLFVAFRIVSLGSIGAALAFAVTQMVRLRPEPFAADRWSLAAFSLAIPALIILRHRSNIVRLWRGEENRFRSKPKSGDSAAPEAPASPGPGPA